MADTEVVIISTDKDLDLSLLDNRVRHKVVNDLNFDYGLIGQWGRWPAMIYYRWEVFINPLFLEYDNLLYLDSDTEICGSFDELFIEHDKPMIRLVPEWHDCLSDRCNEVHCENYYNSGVMFLTPRLFGRTSLVEIFSALIKVAMTHRFKFPDQDDLNYVLAMVDYPKSLPKDKHEWIVPLSTDYNVFGSTIKHGEPTKIIIIHHVLDNGYELKYI